MWHDSQSEIWRVTWFSEPGLVCLLEFTGMLFDMWPVWNVIVRPSKRGKKAAREPEMGDTDEEGFLADVEDCTIVFDRILDVQTDKKMFFVVVKHISSSELRVSLLFL